MILPDPTREWYGNRLSGNKQPPRSRFWLGVFVGIVVGLGIGKLAFGQNSPADELVRVVQDIQTIPPESRGTVRYLSLYNYPPDERDGMYAGVAYALNAISQNPLVIRPYRVTQSLVRLDFIQLSDGKENLINQLGAWERLVLTDPFWHIRTEVADGQKTKLVTVDGGWIPLEAAQALKELTGSNGALLRADYFVDLATQPPFYFSFATVFKKESDFLAKSGIDEARPFNYKGANLATSNVVNFTRQLTLANGGFGSWWRTFDVNEATAQKDFLRIPFSVEKIRLAAKFDASEHFVMQANGFWKVAIFDAEQKRLDVVDSKIAHDTSEPQGDGIIRTGQSCFRCHEKEIGLRSFADDQTRQPFGSPSPHVNQALREFYRPAEMLEQMKRDREIHKAAVEKASGTNHEDTTEAFASLIRDFEFATVTTESASRDLGCTEAEFVAASKQSTDPVNILLGKGGKCKRGSWSANISEMFVLAGNNRKGNQR